MLRERDAEDFTLAMGATPRLNRDLARAVREFLVARTRGFACRPLERVRSHSADGWAPRRFGVVGLNATSVQAPSELRERTFYG